MTQDNTTAKVEVKRDYYESGALWSEIPYVNGKIHGVVKWYCMSGALSAEIPYENGEKHGIGKEYFESGVLCQEIPFKNGKRHGIGKKYNREKSSIDRLTRYNKDREVLSLRCEG